MIRFKLMHSAVLGVRVFGATDKEHSYVLSEDGGKWRSSRKAFDGGKITYFGPFKTRREAERAVAP